MIFFLVLHSPDQPLYTNHRRAGQKTRPSQPPEDKNKRFPPVSVCFSELSLWPPGNLQDSSALVLQTNPVTRGHTHIHSLYYKSLFTLFH